MQIYFPTQTFVKDFHTKVIQKHGTKIASKFYHAMVEWDGTVSVLYAFYNKDVLETKLKEVLEGENKE